MLQAASADRDPRFEAPFAAASGYRRYVMWLLLAFCTLNFLDRQVINILAEPIKREFHLRDAQVGMLTGFYFALFYSVLSLPLARIADRGHRSWLMAGTLALWSLFTAASGFARSYMQLAAFRLMVGIGEAGGSPTAQSLISDYHAREERATAISFYTSGIALGSLLGLVLGGVVLDQFGWRVAFLIAGAPGLLLALLIAATVREPRRSATALATAETAPPLREALTEIWSKRALVLIIVGGSLTTFVNYGQGAFLPSFFFRNHQAGLDALAHGFDAATGAHLGGPALLGILLGLGYGIGGVAGTLAGGRLTDRRARRDLTAYVWIQVVFTLCRLPLFWMAMLAPTPALAIAALAVQSACMGVAGAPAYAAVQGLVRPRVRGTASAIFLVALNLIGLGLGPPCVGALSDVFATHGWGPAGGLRAALAAVQLVLLVAVAVTAASRTTFRRDFVS